MQFEKCGEKEDILQRARKPDKVQCEKCGEKEDILQQARKPDKVQCEKCGKGESERVLSQLHKVCAPGPN